MEWNCFISHRVADRAIAKMLKFEIESLTKNSVEAYVCEQNQGGKEWRKEIVDNIIKSSFMIFLYTVEDYDWRWCLYEIGMFNYKKEYEARCDMEDEICEDHQKNALLYFKNPHIKKIFSPLADFEFYEPNKDGIGQFYDELLNGRFTDGKILRQDRHKAEVRNEFDNSVIRTKEKFDQSRLVVDYYDKRITINLKPSDEDLPVEKIEDAIIEINASTTDILRLPPGNEKISWKILYKNFFDENQSQWLEELNESIQHIQEGCQPNRIMTPFKRGEESYIPVISKVEKLLPIERGGKDSPTKLNVIFIPRSFAKKGFLSTSQLFIPICTVRMKWKKKSGVMEYLESDGEGELVVSDANELFMEMFNLTGQLRDPDEPNPATLTELMKRIEDYIVDKEKNISRIYCDQDKLAQEIIFKCGRAEAKVPLPFNDKHPSAKFRGQCYLPSLMSKEIRGDENKKHSTFYLIAYLKDFWPIDHEKNPYHEKNPQFIEIKKDCESRGITLPD